MADPSKTPTPSAPSPRGAQSVESAQGMQGAPGQGAQGQGTLSTPEAPAPPDAQRRSGPLQTPRGDTTIEETVVQKLAGMATREVPGVYAMGNAARRAFSSMTERIPGSQTNVSNGVSVEKGERQAAVDVSIVVEYGYSVVEVSQGIRRNVIRSVENATGLEVLEVNVNVTDVHLPGDNQDEDDDSQDAKPSKSLE
ncbi:MULTISPECIES: Asp23/Gls24 family envelope stress response protein [unclassified Arthrobacter]|uniref:Asp23/Gls24 family envelope stress response protein n=1 Tax=unclassified Arthrobacter TaxID=235627 RepID=UPI001D13A8F5|nr:MULTISPECIES: Asp23/Gls24 family envelope stress response protein [unclassified Arthrobacter]MCC3278531.1 Asp23/Gls24 family envelope stress response protein [Arthrobacter sp. zg-Y40]MCC9176902.1 Asp23/Gls24 family envelope stress response protein [Arthrobacter sp. zg-Y750]MDK1326390.1 Asp23/Gls24 family envelope stress response protein [Arthrobacter sp. zg-Y1143]